LAALSSFVLAAGCAAPSGFQCEAEADCDARREGRCESDGMCSYPDADCTSGRRYGDAASVGGQCVSSAIVGEIDASPATSTPDARTGEPLMPADAGSCLVDLLVNGNFDVSTDAGWSESLAGGMIVAGSSSNLPGEIDAYSAPNLGWLGRLGGSDSLRQDVEVPSATRRLVLRGRRWIDSREAPSSSASDSVKISLLETDGDLIEVLKSYDDGDETSGWVSFSATADRAHAGKTLRVELSSRNDDEVRTSFFFDDLVLEAATCPSDP
jgi:hypothetical protein